MNLTVIRDLLQCAVLTGDESVDIEVDTAVASDGMSVVLAAPHPRAILITGLAHMQSVRTANMADIAAIVYVRGIRPNGQAVELARVKKIALLTTKLGMFEACAILSNHGIKGAS